MYLPSPRDADRLAHRVLTNRLGLRPGENVTIEAYPSALPWAVGFVRAARRLGASPLLHYEDENAYWAAVEEGRAALIGAPGSHEWAALSKTDVYVYFWGPEDQNRMSALPERVRNQLVAFNSSWYTRAKKAGVRGVRMGIARVTPAAARRWGVALNAWSKELAASTMLDPRSMARHAEKIRKALEGAGEARVRHPNGTDLTLRLVRRKSNVVLGLATPAAVRRQSDGFGFMASVPDGSVYVAPSESMAEGTFVSNRMVSSFGSPVLGGRWNFRDGRLVHQSYATGGTLARKAYSEGKKGRDLPAMLEVGLDPTTRIAPTLQENVLGAISVGIGSNVGFGGTTNAGFNAIMTVAGADLSVDGREIVRKGRIL